MASGAVEKCDNRLRYVAVMLLLSLALFDSWASDTLGIYYANAQMSAYYYTLTMALVLGLFYVVAKFIRGRWRAERFAFFAEAFGLCFVAMSVTMVYSYVAMGFSASRPYLDAELLALDQALGYRWEPVMRWLASVTYMPEALLAAYFSLKYQLIFAVIAFAFTRDYSGFYLMLIMFLLLAIACCALSCLVPAKTAPLFFGVGEPAMPYFALGGNDHFGGVLDALRSGHPMLINRERLVGIVTFPSFHASLAVLLIWVYWRWKWFRGPAVALNLASLPAALYIGAHYLIDILVGALMAAVCIAGVCRMASACRNDANAGSAAG